MLLSFNLSHTNRRDIFHARKQINDQHQLVANGFRGVC